MKKQHIALAATALVVVIGACVVGGWAIVNRSAEVPQPAPTPTTSSTPASVQLPTFNSTLPTPTVTLPPVSTETATPAPTVEPSQGATVTKDEDGNQTIKPNWSTDKLPEDANVVPRQPDTNMSGGGGKLPTDQDGVYRGDHVTPSPTPSSAPTASPSPSTPATSAEPSTPPATDGGGVPSRPGYNGEKSGAYTWFDGFGWIIPEPTDGGEGGTFGEPGVGLSGEKIGDM